MRSLRIIARRHHCAVSSVGSLTVRAVHRLQADIGTVPGLEEHIDAVTHVACSGRATRAFNNRMPGTMITTRLTLVTERCLKFHRLIRVLLQVVGARRRAAARVPQVWSQVDWVDTAIIVAIVRVTFQAHLIFTRYMRCRDIHGSADSLLDLVGSWQ